MEKSTNKSINIIEKDFAKHTDKVNSDVEKFRSEIKEAFDNFKESTEVEQTKRLRQIGDLLAT